MLMESAEVWHQLDGPYPSIFENWMRTGVPFRNQEGPHRPSLVFASPWEVRWALETQQAVKVPVVDQMGQGCRREERMHRGHTTQGSSQLRTPTAA
jgi:hypothetical protein